MHRWREVDGWMRFSRQMLSDEGLGFGSVGSTFFFLSLFALVFWFLILVRFFFIYILLYTYTYTYTCVGMYAMFLCVYVLLYVYFLPPKTCCPFANLADFECLSVGAVNRMYCRWIGRLGR